MIHCKKYSDILKVPNRAGKAFCNAGGWDVYQVGDEIPVILEEQHFPVLSKVDLELKLLKAGKLEQVESAVAGASREIQIWYGNNRFERFNPILLQMVSVLGWNEEQVNLLWLS